MPYFDSPTRMRCNRVVSLNACNVIIETPRIVLAICGRFVTNKPTTGCCIKHAGDNMDEWHKVRRTFGAVSRTRRRKYFSM